MCVEVCCRVMRYVAVVVKYSDWYVFCSMLPFVAVVVEKIEQCVFSTERCVCCSVLQCVAVCCSGYGNPWAACVLWCVCCSVLQCVAVCCSGYGNQWAVCVMWCDAFIFLT